MRNNNVKQYRDYIKSPQYWKNTIIKFNGFYYEDKVPIKKIKINRKLFSFDNLVDKKAVFYIIANFSKDIWMPITVNKDYYLLDGQHRLEVAKGLGLNYIDVIIEDKDKIEYSKKPVKLKKMTMKELINL